MLEWLAFVIAFGVISPDYYRCSAIREHFHILIFNQVRFVRGILQICKELGLIHHRAIVVRIDKIVGYHAGNGRGIVM